MAEETAMVIVLVTAILTGGFVAIARPVMKPLVRLLEAMIKEREPGSTRAELSGIRDSLERVEDRMVLLEERQSFYEALGSGRESPPAPPTPLKALPNDRES